MFSGRTLIKLFVAVMLSTAPAWAQTTGTTGTSISTGGDPPTPRNNVRGSALSARAPGNWIKKAVSGGNTITETASTDLPLRTQLLQAVLKDVFDTLNKLLLALQAALGNPDTGGGDTTNQAPTASFTATPVTVTIGESVSFDATATTDPNTGDVLAYSWNFGDNTTGDHSTVSHIYTAVGIYTVTLTVSDGNGGTDTAAKAITVIARPTTSTVEFSWVPVAPVVGQMVTFNGSSSTGSGGTLTQFVWDFGDGGTETGAVVNHAYTVANTYTVKLTVRDSNGGTNTTTHDVTVTAAQ